MEQQRPGLTAGCMAKDGKKLNMKILIVYGTRPEAIKLAPVIAELKKFPDEFDIKVLWTGQHQDIIPALFGDMSFKPDYRFNINPGVRSLTAIRNSASVGVLTTINSFEPDYVMVQGDTTSGLAAAITAFENSVKIIHVEAGLRTYTIHNPFPEEFNRKIIDQISNFCFAPTIDNMWNLRKEGKVFNTIKVTGNTIVDILNKFIEGKKNRKKEKNSRYSS